MSDDRINPLGWGILFITFTVMMITIPSLQNEWSAYVAGGISAGLSLLMLAAVVVPRVRRWLEDPPVNNLLKLWVLSIFVLSFFITWLLAIGSTLGWMQWAAVIAGFLWLLVYLCILSAKVGYKLGILYFLVLLGVGIVAFIRIPEDTRWEAGIFVVLAVASLVCSIGGWKWLKNLSLF